MDRVEDVLHAVGMWDVTKNRLDSPAKKLSAGEGQKLCLARALIIEPYLLLLDEPTANIDPISASMLEELLDELRSRTTIMMITHSMRQGARISQQVIFMHLR